jgi:O-antigen/teichoic acid export membrane protein
LSELKRKITSGLKWSAVQQLADQILRIGITVILVRLLDPEAFGMIAMITVFTGFSQVIINFGFRAAIIQKQDITDRELHSIFWFNTVVGALLMIAIAAAGPLIARFYEAPDLIPLTIFISTIYFFSGLNVVQNALFNKRMEFRTLAIRNLGATILAGAIAIWMALSGMGYWSLAFQLVAAVLFNTVFIWLASPWKPKWHFRFADLKKTLNFSGYIFINESLNYLTRNVDNVLVGKFFGKASLGLYSKSFSFIDIPVKNVTNVLTRVLFPAFSSVHGDLKRLKRYYHLTVVFISIAVFPFMSGIMIGAEEFVLIVFGRQWIEITPYVSWFCAAAIASAISRLAPVTLLAMGKSREVFLLDTIKKVMIVTAVVTGSYFGVLGVVIGRSLSGILSTFVSFAYVSKHLGISVRKQLLIVAPQTVLTLVLLAAAARSGIFSPLNEHSPLFALAGKFLIVFSLFSILYFLFFRSFIANFFKRFVNHGRPNKDPYEV